jgi:hypothetical protein
MNHTIIPNTNHALRAVLVLHGAEVQTFPVIAWRVDAETGTNIPVLAGGTQIGTNESLENWAITEQGSEMVCPLDPGALPTTRKAFVARNATV